MDMIEVIRVLESRGSGDMVTLPWESLDWLICLIERNEY